MIAPDWFDRYSVRVEEYRLPAADSDRIVPAESIGADGYRLLSAIHDDPTAPNWLQQLPAVEFFRQVWIRQFYAESGRVIYWRDVRLLCKKYQLCDSLKHKGWTDAPHQANEGSLTGFIDSGSEKLSKPRICLPNSESAEHYAQRFISAQKTSQWSGVCTLST